MTSPSVPRIPLKIWRAFSDLIAADPEIVGAEEYCGVISWLDVRPILREWRESRDLRASPLTELRRNFSVERITEEHGARNSVSVSTYA